MRRNLIWLLLGFAFQCVLYGVGCWASSHVSLPWKVLVVLVSVLVDLIRHTGERGVKYRYPISGPITLAGPVHPWQAQND